MKEIEDIETIPFEKPYPYEDIDLEDYELYLRKFDIMHGTHFLKLNTLENKIDIENKALLDAYKKENYTMALNSISRIDTFLKEYNRLALINDKIMHQLDLEGITLKLKK